MRFRYIGLLLLVCLVVTGCFGSSGSRTLNVRWERVERGDGSFPAPASRRGVSLSAASYNPTIQEPILSSSRGYEFHYQRTPLDWSVVHVTAEMQGVGRGEHFDFMLMPPDTFAWERLSGDAIELDNTVSGEGRVIVTRGDVMREVPFIIFKSGGIVNSNFWDDMKQGFSFVDGIPTSFDDGDIRMEELVDDTLYAPYGMAVVLKGDDFWGDFPFIADVRDLDYSPGSIPFNANAFDYVYIVRTVDGGFAKMIFTANRSFRGNAWSFIYDYSPDGVFETY